MRISDWSSDVCSSDLLGGTKIEGVIIESRENPVELARLRVPTGASEGYQHIINQVITLIGALKKETGLTPESIGIGTPGTLRSEEHTSELQSLMRISYAVFCLKNKTKNEHTTEFQTHT